MKAKIVEKTKERLLIQWDGKIGYGQLEMFWDQKLGRFILDSEMVGIDTVIEIFKALE